MSKRISAIDWIKFVLAGFILCLHYGGLCVPWTWGGTKILCGANLAVEGFFLISGFLFMQSLEKYEKTGAYPACPKVVFHRYLGIFYWLLPAVILDTVLVATGVEQLSFADTLANIPKLLFELVPLQMAGFSAWYVTGVSWYISALLLAVLFFYPLARRNPRSFAREFCPIAAVVLYGLLFRLNGKIGNPGGWLFDIVHKGLVRGLADMALGCFLYECIRATKDEIVTGFRRALYTIAATVSAFLCVVIMVFTYDSIYDFVFLLPAFAFLYLAIGQKTVFALFLNHEWTRHIGTFSTAMFLVHYPLARYFAVWYPPDRAYFVTYLLDVLAAAIIVFFAGTLFKWAVKALSCPKETDSEELEEANETEEIEEKGAR